MSARFHDYEGELCWREGKQLKVRVCIKSGQLSVHRINNAVVEFMKKNDLRNERTIKVPRTGSSTRLGMDLKGGINKPSEDKLVQVYKITEGGDIDRSGEVMIDDVLLHVNGEPMLNKSLDTIKKFIASIKDVVELHIAQAKPRELSSQDEEVDLPPAQQGQDSVKEMVGEGMWIPVHDSSLGLSQLTSYRRGNNIPLPFSMSLSFVDHKQPLLLQCSNHEPDALKEWTHIISTNIVAMNEHKVEELKANFDLADLISCGWIFEYIQSSKSIAVWVKKFLVLRKEKLQMYDKFPKTAEEWQRCERSYDLINTFVRPLNDGEMTSDARTCSIFIQTPTEPHIISLEYPAPYHYWLQSIHRAQSTAVTELQTISFKGGWNKRYVNFILDLEEGFIIEDHTTKAVYWQKPFSDLKDSSDNGHSTLKFEFGNNDKQNIEFKDPSEMARCIHCIEAFMRAKVNQKELNDLI